MGMIMNQFVKVGHKVYNLDTVASIDASQVEQLRLTLILTNGATVDVEGLEAIEVIMATKPSFFEGKRLKFPKRMWILHNVVAHPLMQVLSLVGLRKQGLWLHDITVPRPIGIKS
jgi:hypothetical protein